MKNIILLVLAFATFAASAQRKPKIKGNRSIVDVSEDLPFFNAIEVQDDLEIFLKENTIPGYAISADDNLIDILRFNVVDSTLVIRSYYNITAKKKLEITVNYNDLKRMVIQQGSVVAKDIINADELNITTFGTSKIELNAKASVIHINMEGNSTGNLNLQADSLNLVLKDKIDLNIYGIIGKSNLEMYDNAFAVSEGTADSLNIKLFGNSDFRAEKMETGIIIAELEETTKARLYAFKSIELSSSGSSKTYLWGNPQIIIHEFLNSSELYKREE